FHAFELQNVTLDVCWVIRIGCFCYSCLSVVSPSHTLVLSAQFSAAMMTVPGGVGILGYMDYVLPFATLNAVKDLQSFVTRAKTLDTTGVRFQVAGDVLAISVSVMHPGGLGDKVPMVVGMRTLALDF